MAGDAIKVLAAGESIMLWQALLFSDAQHRQVTPEGELTEEELGMNTRVSVGVRVLERRTRQFTPFTDSYSVNSSGEQHVQAARFCGRGMLLNKYMYYTVSQRLITIF